MFLLISFVLGAITSITCYSLTGSVGLAILASMVVGVVVSVVEYYRQKTLNQDDE